MAASFVQLNAGTGGAKAQTVQNTIGANVVDANAVVLHDAAGLPISTLPVSLATAPTTPVTGTFWQATQPVSGTVGVSGSVAVTGTFWQATQPVSIASLPALATGANVIGAVTQSGTWNVGSITTLPVIADSTATGAITATDAAVAAPAGAGAFVTGASTAGSIVAIACRGSDSIWNCQVTALTTGTLWFEGSMDSTNGTDGNWINLNGLRDGVLATVVQQNATANGMYSGNVAGLSYLRIRSVGTLTGTPAIRWRLSSGTSEVYLASSLPPGTNAIGKVETESAKATFFTAVTWSPAATATDVFIISGSATKTIKVKRLSVMGQATTAGSMLALLIKRTTANTGGTTAALANGTADSNNAAMTAAPLIYTANPTALGTGGGNAGMTWVQFPLAGSANNRPVVWDWSNRNDQAVTLRGTAQSLVVNLNGASVPAGGVLIIEAEWTEE